MYVWSKISLEVASSSREKPDMPDIDPDEKCTFAQW